MIAGKRNLVVSGCSFTKGHNLHEKGSFATYLGEMTDTKVHNVAKGGHGNEMINFTITSYIENLLTEDVNDIFVIIGWSECFRNTVYFDAPNPTESNWSSITAQSLNPEFQYGFEDKSAEHLWLAKNSSALFPFFCNYEASLMKTYQNMFLLKNYLEHKNIPYLFFDAINDHRFYEEDGKYYLKASSLDLSPFELNINPIDNTKNKSLHQIFLITEKFRDLIYDKTFYTEQGLSMNSWLEKMDRLHADEFPLRDGRHSGKYSWDNDGHPGAYGSMEWAKLLLEYINKIYPKTFVKSDLI